MEDESISEQMLAITVADAKVMIKEKKFIQKIYQELMKSHMFKI